MPVRKKKRSKEIFFIAFKSNEIIAFPWAILNAEYYLNERGCVEICLVKKKKRQGCLCCIVQLLGHWRVIVV